MNARLRGLKLVGLVGVMSLLLVACGGNAKVSSGHNSADVNFAQMMIPHHEQAIAMSRLVEDRANSDQIRDMARSIEAAQGPEIAQMRSWLEGWGEGEMQGDHSDHDMPGMIDSESMQRLTDARGNEFDDLFLQLMISHHEGAIGMAREVQSSGESEEVRRLAGEIVETQQSEVDDMKEMIDQR